ncbi:MAG: 5'-nucleotidase [Stygiobacter sp.]|nr:MAG: 5'-nucleotidase [Stygiobacter sp.]KAF0214698.1 MAG: hypothetical protein FD178_2251 [Ignavibacteria bacterium]
MKEKSEKHAILILIFIFVSIIFNSGSYASICSVGGDGSGCLRGGLPKTSQKIAFRRMFRLENCRCKEFNRISTNYLDAPISITYQDMMKAYNAKNDIEYSYSKEDSTYKMNIGKVDLVNAQHWVMPNCSFEDNDYGEGILPSKTSYLNSFPTATHCKLYKYDTEEYYEYYQFSQEKISLIGTVYHDITAAETEIDTADFLMTAFPLDINSRFVSGDSVCVNDTCFVYHEEIAPYGFGTLTTPYGDLEVLVLVNNYREVYYEKGKDPKEYIEKVLVFISKEGHQLNVVVSENSPQSGDVVVDWMEYVRIVYNSTEVKTNDMMPTSFKLFQNYPNPFNPTTNISYQLPTNSHVTLKVYDVLGRIVAELVNEEKSAGSYTVKFDGTKFSSGVYFYTIKAGNFSDTKKLLLAK